jgi:hypothetical protein
MGTSIFLLPVSGHVQWAGALATIAGEGLYMPWPPSVARLLAQH